MTACTKFESGRSCRQVMPEARILWCDDCRSPDPRPPARVKDPDALARFRLEHLNEPCDHCQIRRGIHAHHGIFRSQGGGDAPENLAWLCGVCHDAAHGIRRVG